MKTKFFYSLYFLTQNITTLLGSFQIHMKIFKIVILSYVFLLLSFQSRVTSGSNNSPKLSRTCLQVQQFFNRNYASKDRIFHDFDKGKIAFYGNRMVMCHGGYMTERTPMGVATCYIYAIQSDGALNGTWGYGEDSPSIMEGLNSRKAKDWCRYRN